MQDYLRPGSHDGFETTFEIPRAESDEQRQNNEHWCFVLQNSLGLGYQFALTPRASWLFSRPHRSLHARDGNAQALAQALANAFAARSDRRDLHRRAARVAERRAHGDKAAAACDGGLGAGIAAV